MSEWQALAAGWEGGRELSWRATRHVSEWLVSRLDPQPGQTILELAAGTGETGFLASERLGPTGRLLTSDLEPAMVAAAERAGRALGLKNVEFRVLDTAAIALPDRSVDGVLSRFGYVLRGSPPTALSEIRRVLKAGGRFGFAVWAERSQNSWMTVPAEVMVERGHLSPPGADEQALSERRQPDSIAALLAAAGFDPPELEALPVTFDFGGPGELWRFVSELRGPVSLALAGLPEAERAGIRSEIEGRTARPGGGYELSGVSLNVVTA